MTNIPWQGVTASPAPATRAGPDSAMHPSGPIRRSPERTPATSTSVPPCSNTACSVPAMALAGEFTVEPFVGGLPGPHGRAAFAAATSAELEVECGPFGTTMVGADDAVFSALDAIVRAAFDAGATRISVQVARTASARP